MLRCLLLASALLPVAAIAQTPVAPVSVTASKDDVVVTGQRLSDTRAALEACLSRHCPPDEDIKATLMHAENQFVAGNYQDARSTLLASIGRNKKRAKAYPVPVSDLLRAQARVAEHLGELDSYRVGQIDSLDALRAGLPGTDSRVLAQRIEVADAFAQLGRDESALLMYRSIAADARAAGDRTIEGYALLRRAVVLSTIADVVPSYQPDARAAIAVLTGTADPALAPFQAAARLLDARRQVKSGNTAAVDQLVARYATPGKTPHLLYAPPFIEQDLGTALSGGTVTNKLAVRSYDDQWVDVGFWIKPDGTVSDVQVLRQSPHFAGSDWLPGMEKVIAARRYSPFTPGQGDPGMMRVERYTRTAAWNFDSTGTHLRVRSATPRIEMLDLTAEPATRDGPAGTAPASTTATPAGVG